MGSKLDEGEGHLGDLVAAFEHALASTSPASLPAMLGALEKLNALAWARATDMDHPARLIYPIDGPVSRYFYHHTEPVVPAWWLTDEILPSIERAIASYHGAKR